MSGGYNTCRTVVPGSTNTLFPSTNTSIFSGAFATLAVVRDDCTAAKAEARVGAPNDRARVSGVRIIVCK